MKQKLRIFVTNTVARVAKKIGIGISIGEVSLPRPFALRLHTVNLTNKQQDIIADINQIYIQLYFWQSLFSFSFVGRTTISGIHMNWAAISMKPIEFHELKTSFSSRSHRKITFSVEVGNLLAVAQLTNTRNMAELLLDFQKVTWDDFMIAFGNNVYFDYLKQLTSNTSISIIALLRKGKNKKQFPFFNAKIQWDGFVLTTKEGVKETIDMPFLQDALHLALKKKGGKNIEYISYSQIPEHFVRAVLCTEDPNFFQHAGVDPSFVGLAMHTNEKSRAFTRGASTLTMQLVRNLFLHYKKDLFRKAEECIISLLLENYYKIDKQDIFELYTNIIEFAPNVYGLSQASHFYFGKSFSELTLTECLVLTYIIPRPKHFFDALLLQTEQLRTNLCQHIQSFSVIMLRKGLISAIEYQLISYTIIFANPFETLVLRVDTTGDRVTSDNR